MHSQIYLDDKISEQNPFISLLMNKVQMIARTDFNKYMDDAISEMKESSIKSGVLPHMKKLPVCIFSFQKSN